jgi:Neprosin
VPYYRGITFRLMIGPYMHRGIRTGLAALVGCLALSGIVGTSAASAASPAASLTASRALARPASDTESVGFFAGGDQEVLADGTSADLTVANPRLAARDFLTEAFIEAASPNDQQVVQVGWVVDRGVFKNSGTHLFTDIFVNNRFAGFDADFKSVRGACKLGGVLRPGGRQAFSLLQHAGGWQVRVGGRLCGQFPDSLWHGKLNKAGLFFWEGEVDAASSRPATQMGDGKPASAASAAEFSHIALFTTTGGKTALPRFSTFFPSGKLYSARAISRTALRFGGAGA